ncbi:hypothetical protein HMPREF1992_01783 [Selenomonas sp. oral taxon 892 str. F0426]|nr:hypothetical protein HMPREF1992_01783 [Selenomonas sp. oral taxon 892 str. F0426]
MFPQGAYTPSSRGNLCVHIFKYAQISSGTLCPLQNMPYPKEKAHSAVCRTGFFGIVTQFPTRFGQHLPNSLSRRTNPQNLHPHHSQVNR